MKNNKKGFTLVELLAAIAILVIIELPNVMGMFTGGNNISEVYARSDKCTLIKYSYPSIKCTAI